LPGAEGVAGWGALDERGQPAAPSPAAEPAAGPGRFSLVDPIQGFRPWAGASPAAGRPGDPATAGPAFPIDPVEVGPIDSPPPSRVVRAQSYGYAPEDHPIPLPLYSEHADAGGFYAAIEFIMFRQSIPITHQELGYRGFVDADGSLTGTAGTHIGSGRPAIYADDNLSNASDQPGWKGVIGWKFEDGTVLSLGWTHLQQFTYTASVNLIPQGFRLPSGTDADTFISSWVFNFSSDFAGDPSQPKYLYGIWNGASQMNIAFTQRYDQYDLSWRQTIYQEDTCRCYGVVGPKFAWIWERFQWSTIKSNIDTGSFDEFDIGVYNNIVSNRMYGVNIGMGTDWWLGNGFAVSVEGDAAAYLDVVKEWAAYQLGYHLPLVRDKRSQKEYTPSAELEANVALWYYPVQGISLRLGYNVMTFWNTIASTDPVDFNLGGLDPTYVHDILRIFYGFDAGISFTF
jgi:hypothetical protein